ncbi:hypothetical protein HPB50_018515 [Hyalomma asiaticum]|uniref:Uncharacterized protein n=1 Tax=Hyalomma asiaticum TaxID=266040 RepID=A0ACB7TPS7_HYAAI|nr:hypothetical protein HPB50_018515 [Hyalomma asiaticum]
MGYKMRTSHEHTGATVERVTAAAENQRGAFPVDAHVVGARRRRRQRRTACRCARARPALSRGEKGCPFSVRPLVGRRCTAAAHWRSGEESPRQAHRPRSDVPPSWARGRPTSCGARALQCQRLLWHGRSSATTCAHRRPGPPPPHPPDTCRPGVLAPPPPPPHLWITEPPQRWIVRRSRTPTVVCVCACSAGHDNHPQGTRLHLPNISRARAGGAFSALDSLEKARPNTFACVKNIAHVP